MTIPSSVHLAVTDSAQLIFLGKTSTITSSVIFPSTSSQSTLHLRHIRMRPF